MLGERARVVLRYVAANTRRLRARRDFTQEELAEATGLDTRFVQRVERGTINMSIETLVRIADGLGVLPGALLRTAHLPRPRPGRPKRR
jgi:transcriptional regulator with XRE-family HTH domain